MFKVPEIYRIKSGYNASDETFGNNGQYKILRSLAKNFPKDSKDIAGLLTQASDGARWEHVSVSVIPKPGKKRRLPKHEEMEFIRFLFWSENDWVVEFHPPFDQYVSNAPCLHLWRPIDMGFPTPNSLLVGLKSKKIESIKMEKKDTR